METIVRDGTTADVSRIYRMMREFAVFEYLEQCFQVTEERLYDALFGTNAFLEALLAERSAQAIGYALFFPVFASFSGERRLFLEDLYVAADARGSGVGRQLLREIARRGLEKGFTGIEFHVPQWNRPAIKFYENLGAIHAANDLNYKFIGEAFRSLAA